jgi:hypothetical protein
VTETQVECYSGYRYGERPRAVYWQGARLEVKTVLERWRGIDGNCFKVLTVDGQIFQLCYSEDLDEWWVDATP